MAYRFKEIAPVPPADQFVDIVLSGTQRRTPTVIHKGYAISRIKSFYMMKVKYTAQTFHDRLTRILDEFPRLDEIHPFYADLMNVLYDRDHYKLALGQLHTCRSFIDNVANDFVKMLKFGDSLYRCKQLKRAALGRMVTVMRKQKFNLAYLDDVRQHLARFPSIDPTTRTIVLTGFPNVGKSTMINNVTNAKVDVQPYPFSTKSLLVGHLEYEGLKWQMLDTPGLLDHELDQRNIIEMQTITALAHLQSAIVFIIDISEQCQYTIEQQIQLFNDIKPLFVNKPLYLACNKIDVVRFDDLPAKDQRAIQDLADENNIDLMFMSTETGEGLREVVETACETLLAQRVDKKSRSKRSVGIVNRLYVSQPATRDDIDRPPVIPHGKKTKKQRVENDDEEDGAENATQSSSSSIGGGIQPYKAPSSKGYWSGGNGALLSSSRFADTDMEDVRKLARDLERENGGPGVFVFDDQALYDLKNDEWKYDTIPHIKNGKNIADFVDVDVWDNLEQLEDEEERESQLYELNREEIDDEELDEHELALLAAEEEKIDNLVFERHMKKRGNKKVAPRTQTRGRSKSTARDLEANLEERGVDAGAMRARSKSRTAAKKQRKQRGMDVEDGEEYEVDVDEHQRGRSRGKKNSRKRARSEDVSESRSVSRNSRSGSRSRSQLSESDEKRADSMRRKANRDMYRRGQAGEADRSYYTPNPSYLLQGKRRLGKTNKR